MARAAPPLESLRRLKSYSDGVTAARRVFSGNLSAMKFVSSAPTIQSIPNLGGIPEVRSSSHAQSQFPKAHMLNRQALQVILVGASLDM